LIAGQLHLACHVDLQGWSSPWSYPIFNGPRKTGSHCRCGWDRQRGVCSPAEVCETRRAYSIFLLASSVYCIVAEWGQRVQRSESACAWRNGVGLTESFSSVRAGDVESAGMLPENSIPPLPQLATTLADAVSGTVGPVRADPVELNPHRRGLLQWAAPSRRPSAYSAGPLSSLEI